MSLLLSLSNPDHTFPTNFGVLEPHADISKVCQPIILLFLTIWNSFHFYLFLTKCFYAPTRTQGVKGGKFFQTNMGRDLNISKKKLINFLALSGILE